MSLNIELELENILVCSSELSTLVSAVRFEPWIMNLVNFYFKNWLQFKHVGSDYFADILLDNDKILAYIKLVQVDEDERGVPLKTFPKHIDVSVMARIVSIINSFYGGFMETINISIHTAINNYMARSNVTQWYGNKFSSAITNSAGLFLLQVCYE